MFYTSASDRLGSQKGYPQSRWFKTAPLTKRALLFSRSSLAPMGTSAAGHGAAVPISTLLSSLLPPRASSLLRPLLLGPCSPCPARSAQQHHRVPPCLVLLSHRAEQHARPASPAQSSPMAQHPHAIQGLREVLEGLAAVKVLL